MREIERVSVVEDVTLISLFDVPTEIGVIADVFEQIAEKGIDVDMISQSPPNSRHSSLSFTVSDEAFGDILQIAAKLRAVHRDITFHVSNGNCKVSVCGSRMAGTPGVAAKVFGAVSAAGAEIRMITTSESEISLLVVQSDLDTVRKGIDALIQ